MCSVESRAQSLIQNDSVNSFYNKSSQYNNSLLNYKRMSFSVDVGVGFGASKYNSGSYTYVSPYLSYLVTPRFKLDVGATLLQGLSGNSGLNGFGGNTTNMMLFARGDYLVTDRLIVSGSAYKIFNNYNTLNTDFNNNKNSFDNYGVSMGMEYKIGEHMIIGAQINVSDGYDNPYNPFYQSQPSFGGFNTGFNHHSSFQRGMPGW